MYGQRNVSSAQFQEGRSDPNNHCHHCTGISLSNASSLTQLFLALHLRARRDTFAPCRIVLLTHIPQLSFHTKGVIPCYLTLESHSAAGLDILANPDCQRIRLRRQLTYFQPIGQVGNGNSSPREEQAPLDLTSSEKVRVRGTDGYLRTVSTEEVMATWCLPPHNVSQEDTLRRLEGEIWLPDTLQPSCETDYLRIEVCDIPSPITLFRPRFPDDILVFCRGLVSGIAVFCPTANFYRFSETAISTSRQTFCFATRTYRLFSRTR